MRMSSEPKGPTPLTAGFQGVKQTKFGDPDGNCFEACIASITKLPLDDIPHYVSNEWFEEYQDWLRERGWLLVMWAQGDREPPPGQCIASGPSPRNIPHSVVYQDGVLLHDPHPSDDGITSVSYWMLLFPALTMLNVLYLHATIDAQAAEIAALRGALEDIQAIQAEYDSSKAGLIPIAGWRAIRERLQHADVARVLAGKKAQR